MTPRFFREGKLPGALGFDNRPSPPWTMLPLKAKRTVTLADGAGLKVGLQNATDSQFVGVREIAASAGGRVFELEGLGAKTVFLEAANASGAKQASLEITVKAQMRLATYFGFVFDSAGRVTPRGYSDAMEIIAGANAFVTPQTNVEMYRADSGGVRLPFELRGGFPAEDSAFNVPKTWMRGGAGPMPCISSRPLGPKGCVIETNVVAPLTQTDFDGLIDYQKLQATLAKLDPKFDYNILFVRNFATRTGLAAGTGGFTPPDVKGVELNICILPDSARGHTLAHELCHYLLRKSPPSGPGHHSNDKRDLIYDAPGINSVWISKDQANVINPSGYP